jgi:hypothetical protein
MDKVRFRSGFPEKIGGWVVQNFQQYIGVARSVFTWGTTDGSELIGIGTDVKMYVSAGTYMYDITPLRTTLVSPATNNCIGTTNTSRDVTITVSGHGLTTGDYVTISGVTGPTVGGIPNTEINAEHVVTVINANIFTITVATAASSTTTGQGGTNISIACQITIGFPGTTFGYGWGTGTWSRGSWGSGSTVPVITGKRETVNLKKNDVVPINISDQLSKVYAGKTENPWIVVGLGSKLNAKDVISVSVSGTGLQKTIYVSSNVARENFGVYWIAAFNRPVIN